MLIIKLADLNQITIDASLLSDQVFTEANHLNQQSNNKRRRQQFLASRFLLASLLKHYYQIPTLPPIIRGTNNRPQFYDSTLPSFNISHSQHFVAVAISDQARIGIDIELNRDRKNYLAIANNFFSAKENQWLHQQRNPLQAFWQLWTLKESALKLYAKGVWQMKSVNIDPEKKVITAPFADHFYYHYQQFDDVHLSITSDSAINNLTLFDK